MRMGIHTGTAELRDGDYFGSALNRAARLMGVAHGGQIVCSQATAELARDAARRVSSSSIWASTGCVISRGPSGCSRSMRRALQRRSRRCVSGRVPGQLAVAGRAHSSAGTVRLARRSRRLSEARVVTLTGVGGVGKTRLALQVAAEVLPQFREGAWLVELAPVRDPDGVVDSSRGGVRGDRAVWPDAGGGVGRVPARQADCCWWSTTASMSWRRWRSWWSRSRRSCADVVVLATSREGLAIDGERICSRCRRSRHHPPTPTETSRPAATRCGCSWTARRRIDADFALTRDNAAAVVQVCRRLDGVPLAIELAAAAGDRDETRRSWPRVGSPLRGARGWPAAGSETSADACGRRSTGPTTCSAKLNSGLLARLAVFAGGCTREAAEVVCGGRADRRAGGVRAVRRASWPVRWWSPNATAPRPGTGCWRRSASTARNASRNTARSNSSAISTLPTRHVRRSIRRAHLGPGQAGLRQGLGSNATTSSPHGHGRSRPRC